MRALIKTMQVMLSKKLNTRCLLVLTWLAQHGNNPDSMIKLAKVALCTPAAMAGVIDVLVKARFVHRFTSPNDRRVIMVELTATGYALVQTSSRNSRHNRRA